MTEYDTPSRVGKRKVLSDCNAIEGRSRAGISNFSETYDPKTAFYHSGARHQQVVSSGNVEANCDKENQKDNFIDFSRIKKEPRVNIHKIERKKEEEPSRTFETQNDENRSPKRKKVENAENDSSFGEDLKPLNDNQDTRMLWNENTVSEFGDLSPSLTDLIIKPRPNKICRPPNAFMLFAKEQRRQVGIDHPHETNRQISIILGNTWRDLSDQDKMKYYKEAQALEKLHKETYPSYVYSPNEARMRKLCKAERKQRLNETPPSSKSVLMSEDSIESLRNIRDAQEKKLETANDNENLNENYFKDGIQSFPARHSYPLMNPFFHPMYFPYPCRGLPTRGSRMPGRSMCVPQCSYPNYGNKAPVKGQSSAVWKGNQPCPPATYFNNPRPFMPFSNPMYPFPPRSAFPDNFQPVLWNPWLLWPGAFYCPPPSTSMEELQKNWPKLRVPQQLDKKNASPTPAAASRADAKSQLSQTQDSDDDDEDEFRPLVIDEGQNPDGQKENLKKNDVESKEA